MDETELIAILEQIDANFAVLRSITAEKWRSPLEVDYEQAFERDSLEIMLPTLLQISPLIRTYFERRHVILINGSSITPPENTTVFEKDLRLLNTLRAFVSLLIRDVALRVLQTAGKWQDWSIVSSASENYRVTLAILLHPSLSLSVLEGCLRLSQSERYTSYKDFALLPNRTGETDPLVLASLDQLMRDGISNPDLTESMVSSALATYEQKHNTRHRRVCARIQKWEDEIVVWILRETRRGRIRTTTELVVGDHTDWVILRYSPNLTRLRVRVPQEVKENEAQDIAADIVLLSAQRRISYVPVSSSNPRPVIENLQARLLSDNVQNVTVDAVHLVQSPFEGSPNLAIERASIHVPLSRTLNDATGGMALIDILNASEISRLKVAVTGPRKTKHVYWIDFSYRGDECYVRVTGYAGIGPKTRFTSLLYKETDVKIVSGN